MNPQAAPGRAGWLPDPTGRFDTRYWDGTAWTQAVMRDGQVDSDPVADSATGAETKPGGHDPTAMAAGRISAGVASPPPEPQYPPVASTDRFTSLSPKDAQARVAQMLAMSGIVIQQSMPGRMDGTIELKREPNWIVVVVLLFLWIVPGVIYWYMTSRPVTHPLSLVFVPVETGTRIALQTSPPVLERLAPILAPLPW